MKFLRDPKIHLSIISLLLFIIPFFWLKPGEMDLGGDSSRLYFYDPINYLKNYSLYNILPFGTGLVEPHFYNLPIVTFFVIIQSVLKSPYLLISIFSSLKLVVAFLAVYGITRELIDKRSLRPDGLKKSNNKYFSVLREISSMFAGLFYIFSPRMIGNWDKALLNHDQVFLNPLIFYLLLKYFLTNKNKYLWFTLIITFIFAHNFSWVSAPLFFAFYPLSLLFLLFYATLIRRKKLPWKAIFIGLLIFVGLQSFHLIPAITSLFDPGSNTNTRVFNIEDISHQLDYFFGVLPLAKVSLNILSLSPIKELGFASIIVPLVVILGFLLNRGRNKTILLTGIFFLIILFLLTAKITDLGVELYRRFFYIPGFSMFRNFIGQWLFVFSFFYALLFGLAIFNLFGKLKSRSLITGMTFLIGITIIISAWPFINGELVNKTHFQSNNVKIAMVMDPKYEETLAFIRSLPDDGKILTLPFTDCCYQVIHGTNNGAYVGVSTIGYLTGKKDFAGYVNIAPFSDVFLKLALSKDYESIKRMLGSLNIRYVFHNADPKIYDTTFPGYPYTYVRQFFPNDQKGYSEFVNNITSKKIFESGPYSIYSVDEADFLPHFYVSANLQKITDYENGLPKIKFEKINPTKYKVEVFEAKKPYVLIFSEAFNKDWEIFQVEENSEKSKVTKSYFDGQITEGVHKDIFIDRETFATWKKQPVASDRHFQINGYANAWNINPQDTGGKENYELIIEMTSQRIFYVSLVLSLIVFLGCVLWGVILFVKGSRSDIIIKKSSD